MDVAKVDHPKMISLILLPFKSQSKLTEAIRTNIENFERENIPFELIVIDDGSKDNSLIEAKNDQRISVYQFHKNNTSPYSEFTGMKLAKGACVGFESDEFQRPADLLIKMYRLWEQGHLLVIPHPNSRNDGFWSDLFSNIYYWLMNKYSEIRFPPGGADNFLADREVVDILNQIIPINTSPLIEVLRLGFSPYYLPFDPPLEARMSHLTLPKKIHHATNNFFAASSFPLRLITSLGFITFLFCFFLVGVLIFAKLFSSNKLFGFPIPGWTTTMITITMFNGLILFSMGIVAEYVWRIYIHVKQRPGYVIKKNRPDPKKER